MISDGYFSSGAAGWIEVICGVMFSGKSEELIRRVRRAIIAEKKVQVFKSHLDERYAGIYHVSSHDGRTVEAVPVDTPEQIARLVLPDTQVVAIDEAQFLDAAIVELVTALADRGRARDPRRHRHRFSRRAVRPDAAAARRRRGRRQAPRDLRDLRQSGEPQPAAHRRQAGALRLADDHGRAATSHTRRVAAPATRCRGATRIRGGCCSSRP